MVKVLCLNETWFNNRKGESSLYESQNTQLLLNTGVFLINLIKVRRGCGTSMYIHESQNFKSQRDLDIITKNVEN